jgi:tyrosyl-tRNA synthetase
MFSCTKKDKVFIEDRQLYEMDKGLEELKERGLIELHTEWESLLRLPVGSRFYLGIDPTAPHLHLGNFVPLNLSLFLAKAGFQPIILFGGATGYIGDPSGKRKERVLLSPELIQENVNSQQGFLKDLFSRLGVEPIFVNNYDWLGNLSLIEFLRDTGKFLTVNYLMAKDSVKLRLGGDGISFTEFTYALLQAHDFRELNRTLDCVLQVGGSDQWGNLTSGLELIRKSSPEGKVIEAHALCSPLLLNKDGHKLGKSESGAIWLNKIATSTYDLYQYLINTADEDVAQLLKLLSQVSLVEIEQLMTTHKEDPAKKIAQRALAKNLCTLFHGEDATNEAIATAEALFSKDPSSNSSALATMPQLEVDTASIAIVELLLQAKLAPSKSEARRLIGDGGVYLNSERVNDPLFLVTIGKDGVLLRVGKKRYLRVTIANSKA